MGVAVARVCLLSSCLPPCFPFAKVVAHAAARKSVVVAGGEAGTHTVISSSPHHHHHHTTINTQHTHTTHTHRHLAAKGGKVLQGHNVVSTHRSIESEWEQRRTEEPSSGLKQWHGRHGRQWRVCPKPRHLETDI